MIDHWFLMWRRCVNSRVPAIPSCICTLFREMSNSRRCRFTQILWNNNWSSKWDQNEALLKEKMVNVKWKFSPQSVLLCGGSCSPKLLSCHKHYCKLNPCQSDFMSCKVGANVSLLIRNFLMLQDPFPGGYLGSKAKPFWMTGFTYVSFFWTVDSQNMRDSKRSKWRTYAQKKFSNYYDKSSVFSQALTDKYIKLIKS